MRQGSPKLRSLPPQPTTFIGRAREVAELVALLAKPGCRLVTVIGPGGIGKTRLAIEAAARAAGDFPDGVVFVALEGASSGQDTLLAIANAAGVHLPGHGEARSELLEAIEARHMLLVADNCEHLIAHATLFSDLLAAAPRVSVLSTSRVTLGLQEEWRFQLDGLPTGDDQQGATALFAERAGRVRPGFSLEHDRAGVMRICELVEGSPLAIELAATWVGTLPVTEIAHEIERGLALLDASHRNIPERHRSIRAVFDHSWHRLSQEEQAVLERLSVFRGGFQRDIAAEVAGASLPVLATLVSKSLVRFGADGRYHLHELVRQYASAHLDADRRQSEVVRDRHARAFLRYIRIHGEQLAAGNQRAPLAALGAETGNIQIAWKRGLEQGDAESLEPAVWALANFFHLRGRYREGIDLLSHTVERLRELDGSRARDRALASALHELGQLSTRIGQFAEAQSMLEEAQAIYDRVGGGFPPGYATDPGVGLGVLALAQGDPSAAARWAEIVRGRAESERHAGNLPYAFYLRAQAALSQGHLDEAERSSIEATHAARASGDEWFLAYCLHDLGQIAAGRGLVAEARRRFEESYRLREEIDDPEGMALALVGLGNLALIEHQLVDAQRHFVRAEQMYREIGDRGGLAAALQGLGAAALRSGDLVEARTAIAEALEIAGRLGYAPRHLSILLDAADALPSDRRDDLRPRVLSAVASHPATGHRDRVRARDALGATPRRDDRDATDAEDSNAAIEGLAWLVREALVTSPPENALPSTSLSEPSRGVLPDPLTERELAVLRLIAAGRSNREIGDELFLTVSTVKWYAGQIFAKLSVRNRTEAVARAREAGLIP